MIELRFKTYTRFSEAFARYSAARRVLHWYGTDHHWVLVLRKAV